MDQGSKRSLDDCEQTRDMTQKIRRLFACGFWLFLSFLAKNEDRIEPVKVNYLIGNNYLDPINLLSSESEYLLKLLIQSHVAGSIIGQGGETLVWLKQKSGAQLWMSKGSEYFPGTTSRVCVIKGSRDAVIHCARCIIEITSLKLHNRLATINERDYVVDEEADMFIFMVVPGQSVGRIIGKFGKNVRNIPSQFKVDVQVSEPGIGTEKEKCLIIKGCLVDAESVVHHFATVLHDEWATVGVSYIFTEPTLASHEQQNGLCMSKSLAVACSPFDYELKATHFAMQTFKVISESFQFRVGNQAGKFLKSWIPYVLGIEFLVSTTKGRKGIVSESLLKSIHAHMTVLNFSGLDAAAAIGAIAILSEKGMLALTNFSQMCPSMNNQLQLPNPVDTTQKGKNVVARVWTNKPGRAKSGETIFVGESDVASDFLPLSGDDFSRLEGEKGRELLENLEKAANITLKVSPANTPFVGVEARLWVYGPKEKNSFFVKALRAMLELESPEVDLGSIGYLSDC
ncbi:unnamed protein product [Notodromas monacha]|uniref:K Homology domain-containing protein n=1 Tax=Notodromas monacha TaxID=399045 RepID=A0A7R9BGW6_9CRUS|nr:unnamed protein product [Notodromas monacha]CAG0915240.1 unnamed protein product [Notodromas monacha]